MKMHIFCLNVFMRKFISQFISILTALFLIVACANQGFPSGGPKDEDPPYIKESTPEQNALNFSGKKIEIEFNELIQLDNVNQKLVVSPPMNKKPSVMTKGKVLEVNFEEELQPNVTYTLDFADAITDNNEGNIIPSFRFSFSTGETVDSLQVSGHLFESDDLSPADGILVMLYSNLADSAFESLVPVRMAKTDEKGYFSIQNVHPGRYNVYALDDKNNIYKHTQPGDRIAWNDSVVVPSFEYRKVIDSISINIDSLTIDSVVISEKLFYTPDSLVMFLFQQDYKQQYLVSDERKEKAKLSFIFNRTLEKDLEISITGHETNRDWMIRELSATNDTFNIWITDSTLYNRDSLSFTLTYPVRDSLKNLVDRADTIAMYFFEKKKSKKKKSKKKKSKQEEEIPHIKIQKFSSNLNTYSANSFVLPAPAITFDASAVHLYQQIDTIKVPVEFDFWQDSLNIRKYYILHKWEAGGSYEMTIDSAAIEDIYHTLNFPISNKFKVRKLNEYGKIFVQLESTKENWLLQVINSKEDVVQQGYVPQNGKIAFQFLKPGNYMLRIVIDNNRNEKWDTGNYKKKIQPESIYYYPGKIALRANWDKVIPDWKPKNFDIYKFSEEFRKPSSTRKQN